MKRIVAIADMHVGSDVALALPDDGSAQDQGYNIRQELYRRWQDCASGPWHAPDALIIDGDIVDGANSRKGGYGLWTTDLDEQAESAAELIKMWDAKEIYILRGSAYHVQLQNSSMFVEERVARLVDAVEYPDQGHVSARKRERSGWHWFLSVNNITFHVQHKISVSKLWHYRTTPLAREMLWVKLHGTINVQTGPEDKDVEEKTAKEISSAFGLRDFREPKMILRAHAHYYLNVNYGTSSGWNLPCWKCLDDFAAAGSPLAIGPKIGMVGFEISDNGEVRHEANLGDATDFQPAPHSVIGEWWNSRNQVAAD